MKRYYSKPVCEVSVALIDGGMLAGSLNLDSDGNLKSIIDEDETFDGEFQVKENSWD